MTGRAGSEQVKHENRLEIGQKGFWGQSDFTRAGLPISEDNKLDTYI